MSTPDHEFTFRKARETDFKEIANLVNDVVNEKYGHLFTGALPISNNLSEWSASWVAESDSAIVGVGLYEKDWITDIWLKANFRGFGIGAALLQKMEAYVASDGYFMARLRVVRENEAAIRFYLRHGWQEEKRYPHELWGFEMVNMFKHLG